MYLKYFNNNNNNKKKLITNSSFVVEKEMRKNLRENKQVNCII